MPASFFNLQGKDLFSAGTGGAQHLVKIPQVDSILGSLAVYDSVSVQTSETVQYFLTFDDVIKFIHFGKGVGTLSVEGTIFSDCTGDIPGIPTYHQAISNLRGRLQHAAIGSAVFAVVLVQAQLHISAEPDTFGKFSFSFSIVNHTL